MVPGLLSPDKASRISTRPGSCKAEIPRTTIPAGDKEEALVFDPA
jgi:hypothetical protein